MELQIVKVDGPYLIEWLYKIISKLENTDEARQEILSMTSYISRAPGAGGESNLPKISS